MFPDEVSPPPNTLISTPAPRPGRPLPEMTFLAPRDDPPIRLLLPATRTPSLFGTAPAPATSVPMRFPWTVLSLLPTKTPIFRFPEMRFPAPGAVPPTVLLRGQLIDTRCQ